MQIKSINKVFALLSFAISFILYLVTMAPTASLWDTGEYISTAHALGVPHAPGAPLYILFGNIFSNIPIFENIGARVNLLSTFSSAFAIMFLYLIIVMLIEYYNGKTKNISDVIIIYSSALIAALTFAVTDSQWFNAVESEVYALSTFFTAITLWLTIKWAVETNDKSWNIRYLLLIMYLIGLSTGVHNLNLLVIPVIGLIIFFKKSKLSNKSIIEGIICTFLLFLSVLLYLIGSTFGYLSFALLIGIIIYLFQKGRTEYFSFVKLSIAVISIFFIIYGGIFIGFPIIANQISNFKLFFVLMVFALVGIIFIFHFKNKIDSFVPHRYLISSCILITAFIFLFLTFNATIPISAKQIKRDLQAKEYDIDIAINESKSALSTKMQFEYLNNLPLNSLNKNQSDSLQYYKQLLNIPIEDLPKEFHEGAIIFQSDISELSKIVDSYERDKINIQDSLLLINNKMESKIGMFGLLSWQSNKTLFIFILIIAIILGLGYFLFRNQYAERQSDIIQIVSTSILLLIIGYSTYSLVFLRAQQEPNINMNDPHDEEKFLYYMAREQYGKVDSFNKKNAIQGNNQQQSYWTRWTENKKNPSNKEVSTFTWEYQIKEMYLRYFAWQFIGRLDKDEADYSNNNDKNFIQKIDNWVKVAWPRWSESKLGKKSNIDIAPLDGINWVRYYIPLAFIFGIVGMIFHFVKDWKRALSVMLFFLITGIILSLYLNMSDPQPRERDYAFVGSYFAFSIWIGIGISFFQQKIKTFFENSNISSFISSTIAVILIIIMPYTMYSQDFIQHNRKHNYAAWDYGYNILNSCEPNAILFTNGDNDTYPLWYLQEVEKIRQDITVVNFSLLNTPWYIEQLIKKIPELQIIHKRLGKVDSDYEDIYDIEHNVDLATKGLWDVCGYSYLDFSKGVDQLFDKVVREPIFNNDGYLVKSKYECSIPVNDKTETLEFKIGSMNQIHMMVQDYMLLEIINTLYDAKPIYFVDSRATFFGLSKYLIKEGMVKRLFNDWNQVLNLHNNEIDLSAYINKNTKFGEVQFKDKTIAIPRDSESSMHQDFVFANCIDSNFSRFQCGYGNFSDYSTSNLNVYDMSLADISDILKIDYYFYSKKENKIYELAAQPQYGSIDNSISMYIKNNHMNYIDYNKMAFNIMQPKQEEFIISNISQYKRAIENNKGIYRYTNFDKPNVYYNDNIKNQVNHYRGLFLHVLQHELDKIIENINLNSNNSYHQIDKLLMKIDSQSDELRIKEIFDLAIGDIIIIDKEKMVIKEIIDNKISYKLIVDRAYDGTIATSHKTGNDIYKTIYTKSYLNLINKNNDSLNKLLNQLSNYFPEDLIVYDPRHSINFLDFYYKSNNMMHYLELKNKMLEHISNQDQFYINAWNDNLKLYILESDFELLKISIRNRDYSFILNNLLQKNTLLPLNLPLYQRLLTFNNIYDNYKTFYRINKDDFNTFSDVYDLDMQKLEEKEYNKERKKLVKGVSSHPMGLTYITTIEKLHNILINKFNDEDYIEYYSNFELPKLQISEDKKTDDFINNNVLNIKRNIITKYRNALYYELNALDSLIQLDREDIIKIKDYKKLIQTKIQTFHQLYSDVNQS